MGTSSTANCGSITGYLWKNGDTTLSTASGFTYTVTLAPEQTDSVITVSLRVTNSLGLTHTAYRTITIKRDHQSQYFVKDHLGSPRVTVDGKGNVLSYADYYPFGGIMPVRSGNNGMSHDRTKFTGFQLEEEGGQDTYHAEARGYDPVIGRFTSRDRFTEMYPNQSPYNYSALNPVNIIDPSGDTLVVIVARGFSSENPYLSEQQFLIDSKIADRAKSFLNVALSEFPGLSVNNTFRLENSMEINTTNTRARGPSRHQAGFAIDLNGVGRLSKENRQRLNDIAAKKGFYPLHNQDADLPHYSANPAENGYKSLMEAIRKNQRHYYELMRDKEKKREVRGKNNDEK